MSDEVKRISMQGDDLTWDARFGLKSWVDDQDQWPSDKWNRAVSNIRDIFDEVNFQTQADIAEIIITAMAALVVQRQDFIDRFLDRDGANYFPDTKDWHEIAKVVARFLVQRYYRETRAS